MRADGRTDSGADGRREGRADADGGGIAVGAAAAAAAFDGGVSVSHSLGLLLEGAIGGVCQLQ